MQNLTSPKVVAELLRKHGFKTKKALGQNFMIDGNIMDKIIRAADIQSGDAVLEVGAGIGALTCALAQKAQMVLAVEIDRGLIPVLQETLGEYPNATIINGDILEIDLYEIVERYFGKRDFKVVANVPYYISTPIIMLFLEGAFQFSTMVLMVQKEVAQRITALPGSKDYGVLSLSVQYGVKAKIAAIVPPTVFMPPPKVDSAIIVLERRTQPAVQVKDEGILFETIRAGFGQRRKKLLNALAAREPGGKCRTELMSILDACGIDPNRRGETLALEEYARIADMISM